MLKKRDVSEAPILYELMKHPDVFPYVRHKTYSTDEFYFLTKKLMEAEENGELISRTIVDEYYNPIGTINLFDIENKAGFLATWIGKPYHGKGYNKLAKDAFFQELFYEISVEAIYIKIRKSNIRSIKAILKIPYVAYGNDRYPEIYQKVNIDALEDPIYDLYVITKENYFAYQQAQAENEQVI